MPIQEQIMRNPDDEDEDEELEEDQYKSPTKKQRLQQNARNRSKYSSGETAFESISFEDRLDKSIKEEIGFVNQEVLFAKPFGITDSTAVIDPLESIKSTKSTLEQNLQQYLMALENSHESKIPELEELIDGCTRLINTIDGITPQQFE